MRFFESYKLLDVVTDREYFAIYAINNHSISWFTYRGKKVVSLQYHMNKEYIT